MHFSAVTLISQGVHPLWGVKQVRGGETRYFRAKCVNITRQMALTAAALPLLQTSRYLVCNLFSRRIGAIFAMLTRRGGFIRVSWAFLYYTVLSVYMSFL